MEKISTEQKLALIEAIRKEQRINQGKIRTRANIVYGESIDYGNAEDENINNDSAISREGALSEFNKQYPSTFRIRMVVAILLFIGFFIMDLQNLSFGSVNSSMILEQITKEFMISIPEYITNFL